MPEDDYGTTGKQNLGDLVSNRFSVGKKPRKRRRSNEELVANQSDLSRHGADNEEFIDLKNRVVNFSSKKNTKFAKVDRHFSGFHSSSPLTINNEYQDDTEYRDAHTVQSIEDATDKLSNLVRLIEENSKMQPSDLTIHSYKS